MRKWFCILQCKAMGPSSIQFDFPQLSFLWMDGEDRRPVGGVERCLSIQPMPALVRKGGASKVKVFLNFSPTCTSTKPER